MIFFDLDFRLERLSFNDELSIYIKAIANSDNPAATTIVEANPDPPTATAPATCVGPPVALPPGADAAIRSNKSHILKSTVPTAQSVPWISIPVDVLALYRGHPPPGALVAAMLSHAAKNLLLTSCSAAVNVQLFAGGTSGKLCTWPSTNGISAVCAAPMTPSVRASLGNSGSHGHVSVVLKLYAHTGTPLATARLMTLRDGHRNMLYVCTVAMAVNTGAADAAKRDSGYVALTSAAPVPYVLVRNSS